MASLLERQLRNHQSGRSVGCAISTTSYESPSPALQSSFSQPVSAESGTHYQFRTLPRQRRNRVEPTPSVGSTHNPSNARRQMVSSAVSDYLKSLNSMTRSIVLEREFVEERHAGEWPVMDETLQEEVVDEHFMPPDVHAHYGTLPQSRRASIASRASRRGDLEQGSHNDELMLQRNRVEQSSLLQQLSPDPTYPPPQPSSSPPTYFISPTYNRLHKNQLSYRSKTLRKVMNMPPSQPISSQYQSQKRDSGLGSDGESPRTSDEDMHNPLGFQRNYLRSYSLRQRNGGSRNSNSLIRSSTRRMHRTAASDEAHGNTTHHLAPFSKYPGQYDNWYDAEVDLPDDSLLLDHVPSHQQEQVESWSPPKPSRYSSRVRRSTRTQPSDLVDNFSTEDEGEKEEVVVIPNSHSRVSSNSSVSTAGSSVNNFDTTLPMFHNRSGVVLTNLSRAQSEDSIDTDTDSIAPSNISILSKSTGILTEDEIPSDSTTIRICVTPHSTHSVASSSATSIHSKTKGGIVRSRPQSLRGGSFYQTSTSDFANRHAQFKPNILRNQLSAQKSPTHTRQSTPSHTHESTPSFSRQNTPSLSSPAPSISRQNTPSLSSPTPPDTINTLSKPSFKSPPTTLSMKQHCGSAGECVSTTDEPVTSPEILSQLSSPPHTPVIKSIMRSGASHHLHVRSESQEEKRESGYISSSSESFAFSARR